MKCSIFAYIDATNIPKITIESTCDRLYTCAPRKFIDREEGIDFRIHGGCLIGETKGGRANISMRYPSLDKLLPETPVKAHMVQTFPPYQEAEIVLVIDSSPNTDFYGMLERKSTVISTTKRTILAGKGVLQLVNDKQIISRSDGESLDEVLVDNTIGFETTYPILPLEKHAQIIRRCSFLHHIDEDILLYQYGAPDFVLSYADSLRKQKKFMEPLRLHAALSKLYAGLLKASNVTEPSDIYNIAVEIAKTMHLSIISIGRQDKNTFIKPVVSGIAFRIKLRKKHQDTDHVVSVLVDRDMVVHGSWEEVSVLCTNCWEPLTLYEQSL
ncbi:hypothetical protein PYJP_09190 [Pyrofollis japonicus]|uniref:hypothetical protein n=1 Tax=Pyrofollis japonicus TaxID=3060460 RepID=UPI00295B7469|nr:hypothetical protein [Pyrofollis japonicus]BEP17567.1 hypothetical protein PYJP_09190 [Pyrofollis japonicus]